MRPAVTLEPATGCVGLKRGSGRSKMLVHCGEVLPIRSVTCTADGDRAGEQRAIVQRGCLGREAVPRLEAAETSLLDVQGEKE